MAEAEGNSSYSILVVEHFARPRNAGSFADAADVIRGRAGSRDQAAEFEVSARVADGRIEDVRFSAYGCPHCVAAGSLMTTSLRGLDLDELQAWSWREIAKALDVPTAKRGRLLILEDAVRSMAQDWRKRR